MKKYLVLTACLFSAGCTDADWDHVLNYGGSGEVVEVAVPQVAAPAAVAGPGEPANAEFCRAVATDDAGSNDFDRATQSRVYARSYAQCLVIYTR